MYTTRRLGAIELIRSSFADPARKAAGDGRSFLFGCFLGRLYFDLVICEFEEVMNVVCDKADGREGREMEKR